MISAARHRLAGWVALICLGLPLLLYFILTSYSRLMGDDYGYFATGLWLGFRDNFSHWWHHWHGSYSYFVAIDLLAPLGPQRIPPVFPTLVFSLWLIALAWLYGCALDYLEFSGSRRALALAMAMLTVTAALWAFPTRESVYWFTAVLRHSLPVGFFMLYVAGNLTVASYPPPPAFGWLFPQGLALVCYLSLAVCQSCRRYSSLSIFRSSLFAPLRLKTRPFASGFLACSLLAGLPVV